MRHHLNIFRRRADLKLRKAHEALQEAYDRLEETTTVKERMESELRIARDIQMSMVPCLFPHYPGLDMYASMRPAKEVGGDLYGYLLRENMLYFAVGDVSGKGVPASLFMAQATRLFQTLAKEGMMPADICTRINDALSGEDNEGNMFVTMFLGLLDLKTGHLWFCNAGHNPPILGGGENGADFIKMLPNTPVGVVPGLEFQGEEIENISGRQLFIYTDGLNEAENPAHEQFGEDRLLKFLRTCNCESAKELIERISEDVERHRDGAEPNGDITMMCLGIKKTDYVYLSIINGNLMKKLRLFFAFSAIALLLGMTGCKKQSSANIQELEQSLVGLWWDEYEYSDVTVDGTPFSRVLLAIKADADHTGCIYLGVFDDKSDFPLAVYGGPEVSGFKWRLMEDGSVELSDLASDEGTVPTRGDDESGSSYGNDMTNVSSTNVTYADGAMTVTNGSYSGTLQKADADKQADIEQKMNEWDSRLDPMGDPLNI